MTVENRPYLNKNYDKNICLIFITTLFIKDIYCENNKSIILNLKDGYSIAIWHNIKYPL